MVASNTNNTYVEVDGVDVSAQFTGGTGLSATGNSQDITAGAGVDHVLRAPGLIDHTLSLELIYDKESATRAGYIGKLAINSEYVVIYGPEGNAAGSPKFECQMILDSKDGADINIEKQKVMWSLGFTQSRAPISTIESGPTF